VKTVSYLRDLITNYHAMRSTVVSLADYDVMAGFKAGTIGMAMLGSYLVTAARSGSSIGTSLRTAPVPGRSEEAPTPARLAAQCLGIGVSTAHADAAWAFIQYYTSVESQLAFAKAGVMPSRQASYANPFFANVEQGKEMTQWRGYATQAGQFELLPNDFTQLSGDLVQAVQEVLLHGADPQAALTAAARQYDTQHSD
jgi:multiple sugar transport system substrate-binding protein